ncbi:hypothetical protein, partial [Gordonibacter sp.]|uniref:hypothetical protein n=1 Tax=Gordonibacter sp. TaxID=1968902 RepID=UPI002FCA813A
MFAVAAGVLAGRFLSVKSSFSIRFCRESVEVDSVNSSSVSLGSLGAERERLRRKKRVDNRAVGVN